jgi:hypothetical protein
MNAHRHRSTQCCGHDIPIIVIVITADIIIIILRRYYFNVLFIVRCTEQMFI